MNLPNKLTLLRVALIPVFAAFLAMDAFWAQCAAACVFLLACLTDLLDGHIARKRNLITDFGKLVDPMADKLLVTTAMVLMTAQGRMAAWVVILFIAREFVVSGFRMVAASNGAVIAAGKLGKYKTLLQAVSITMLTLTTAPGGSATFAGLAGVYVANAILYLALAISVVSCADYIVKNRAAVSRQL